GVGSAARKCAAAGMTRGTAPCRAGRAAADRPPSQRYSRAHMISVVLHGELRQRGAKRRDVDGAGRTAREIVAALGISVAEAAAAHQRRVGLLPLDQPEQAQPDL